MQGWRLDQEDAHNAIINFDPTTNTSFFAVYDGHGGTEVAKYCSKYLPEFLKTLDEYEKGNLEEALKKVFLKFDESLLSESAQKELKEIKDTISRETSLKNGKNRKDDNDNEEERENENGEDDEEDDDNDSEQKEEDEAAQLYDEATMPLEEVLKRYSKTENKVKKALRKKGLIKKSDSAETDDAAATSSTKSKKNSENSNNSETDETPVDFQKQEEIDINEIKNNGHFDENQSSTSIQNHEQDYDEASNLCDLTDSQKSITNDSTLTTTNVQNSSKLITTTNSIQSTTDSAISIETTESIITTTTHFFRFKQDSNLIAYAST